LKNIYGPHKFNMVPIFVSSGPLGPYFSKAGQNTDLAFDTSKVTTIAWFSTALINCFIGALLTDPT